MQSNPLNYQQKQKKAAYDFIDTINQTDDELTPEDYKEFESGKYKVRLNLKDLSL